MAESNVHKGGQFLFEPASVGEIFTREMLTDEQRMMADTAADFMMNELLPLSDEINQKDKKIELNVKFLKKIGELGLLGIDCPEEFGGLGMGLTTSSYIYEESCVVSSFNTSWLAHSGIGLLPLVFFGKKAQKEKYLTKLATGEMLGAYALTEAGSGSDAFSLKTRAVLSEDGTHYILNGEKMFITNSGFADLFVVYAKVNGTDLTAFLVEKDFPGLSTGAEEKKMGIEGSSTRTLILEDVKVPVENVLGEIGKGQRSAMGILDIGRLKLAMASLAEAKYALRLTLKYIKERKQFDLRVADFGMIRRKIADCALKFYATQSAGYRISSLLDEALSPLDHTAESIYKEASEVLEEYNIETAILKVYGSEILTEVCDSCLQMFGGYGFIEEYGIERRYRDGRITRIYEGTNEINRLTILNAILKRSLTGRINFMQYFGEILATIKADSFSKIPAEGPLGHEITAVDLIRQLTVYTMGCVVNQHQAHLSDKTYLLTKAEYPFEPLADMIIAIYCMDSMLLRTLQNIKNEGEEKQKLAILITRTFIYQKLLALKNQARMLLTDCAGGDANKFAPYAKALERFEYFYPLDLASAYDYIAEVIIEREKFPL